MNMFRHWYSANESIRDGSAGNRRLHNSTVGTRLLFATKHTLYVFHIVNGAYRCTKAELQSFANLMYIYNYASS